MDENRLEINKTIIALGEEFGDVIPLDEIYRLHSDIPRKEVNKTIKDFEEEGIISFINKDSIRLNQ